MVNFLKNEASNEFFLIYFHTQNHPLLVFVTMEYLNSAILGEFLDRWDDKQP